MMNIERIEAKNFCNHRHRVVDFCPGLTMLTGPNGSGKSNLLAAGIYALTGENPNAGVISNNICDLADPSEVSYVKTWFSHGGVQGIVKRNLRPNRPVAELELSTGETIQGAEKVNSRIFSILGVPGDILNRVVMVTQNNIFGFLSDTESKRAEVFQRLFRLEQAAVVFRVLTDALRDLQIPALALPLDQLREELMAAELTQRQHNDALVNFDSFENMRQQREANAEVGRNHTLRGNLHTQVVAYQRQRDGHAETLGGVRQQLTSCQADELKINTALANNSQGAAEAARLLAELETNRATERRRAVLNQQIEQLVSNPPQSPDVPVDFTEDLEGLYGERQELQFQWQRCQQLVSSLQDGVAECPVCFTPVKTLEPAIAEANAQLPILDARIKALVERVTRCNTYISARVAFERAEHVHTVQLNSLREQLAATPAVAAATIDAGDLQSQIERQQTLQAGLNEIQGFINNHNQTIARLEGMISQLDNTIGNLEAQISHIPQYTSAMVEAAERNVAYWDEQERGRRNAEQQKAIADSQVTSLQGQIKNAERITRESEIARKWQKQLAAWRDVVHKDAAPRHVIHNNMQFLERGINENLAMFQADFRVAAHEGLSFMAYFANGSRQPAERLSGGQKVVLAFSFLISLNETAAEGLGALYLDEPTAYLDEHHIRGFEPVMQRLRSYSASRGFQVVIITHEQRLAPLFDNVVSL